MAWNIFKIHDISLKWKLLLPFIFLPAVLTLALVVWGIHGQNKILKDEEEKLLRQNYEHFHQRMRLRLDASLALAAMVAADPVTQKAIAEHDRQPLMDKYLPVYHRIRNLFGLKQFHFHVYPGYSLLRLHLPDQYGDELASYRHTIKEAYETGGLVGGLEFGVTGFGIRGIAPVYYEKRLVGSVEIGSSVERPFLLQLKNDLNCIFNLYTPSPTGPFGFRALATTAPLRTYLSGDAYQKAFKKGATSFQTIKKDGVNLAVLTGPVQDFKGENVAVIEIIRDRSDTLYLIKVYTLWIIVVGLFCLLLALGFVWLVSSLFLAPVDALTDQARKIAAGERVPQMEVMHRDEFGVLTEALNTMLTSLELSRQRLEDHAHELEDRVQERTAELVRSEEKFRTLVENIPLVVYRVEPGLVRTFVSSYIEKLTGWPPELSVGDDSIWTLSIHPDEREAVIAETRRCLEQGQVFQMEYRLLDNQGQDVPVMAHAVPVLDESGRAAYMEGYLLDLRERKRLREQTMQAEELRTLGEISARLAHEFRNPLSAVGVAAKRLAKMLDEKEPGSIYANILTEEVSKLEQILRMILTYIQPLSIDTELTEPGLFFREATENIKELFQGKDVDFRLEIEPDLPSVKIDRDKTAKALLNLIRNAVYQIPSRGSLTLCVAAVGNGLSVKLVYPAGYLADDQLRHFFYPFTTEEADASLVDLPLVPVIIHRHKGIISVERQGEDLVVVHMTLPLA